MARRKGLPIDLVWIHLNLSHARSGDVLANAQTRINQRVPEASLSVTPNVANTQALVKVTATVSEIQALPNPVRNAIIRIFTEADHHEAVAMVHTPEWQPAEV